MSKQEVMITPFGEMMDMIDCMAIYEGSAEPKERKKTMEEIMMI